MPASPTISEIVIQVSDALVEWVRATPKQQRRLRSKTFWGYFGYKRRSRELIALIKEAFQQRSLMLNIGEALFGSEDKDEWIVLTYASPPQPPAMTLNEIVVEPTPTPPDNWFAQLERRTFESEREVEYFFVMPLLEQLGYTEDDLVIGYAVQMHEGVKKVNKEADFVLFDGASRAKEHALLVIEAKRHARLLSDDTAGQARGYALWLTTPYYVATNGDEVRVYWFRGAIQADVQLMAFNRAAFREHWPAFYRTLNRAAVIAHKQKWSKMIDEMRPGE